MKSIIREIKFRYIWQGSEKQTKTYEYTLDELEAKDVAYVKADYEASEWVLLGRMQFTGLLDKNGVEIYEGDIIAVTDQNGEMIWIDNNGDERQCGDCGIGVVSFNFGMWYLNEEINNCLFDIVNGENGVEIIGNIYKNPELLKN